MDTSFDEMFFGATGEQPYGFQRRIALSGLPDVARLPMGSGKTAGMVLPWLWRSLFADTGTRAATPRRLVFALPMRTLVDQTEANVLRWLDNLGLADDIAVHVVMGGRRSGEHDWRMDVHGRSVVVGTVDSLVSKALMRGYGTTRGVYPIDFAMITNGSHLVIDEVQLAPASTATLRQLLGFARDYGTAEPLGLTCMSATVDPRVLDTVDNPAAGLSVESVRAEDRTGRLGELLTARKTYRKLAVTADDAAAVARAALDRHRPGTRTLVVVNTVKSAVGIMKALRRAKPEPQLVLIHSRFRGVDRARLATELTAEPVGPGVVAVATQVVEAGVDIDSAVMITEVSPWPSFCQRTGRCNRYARFSDAEVWWFPSTGASPYEPADVTESTRMLTEFEGQTLTGEQLLAAPVEPGDLALRILRRPDFLALFDTTPDLSGADVDISPYIRDGDQLDAQVGWIQVAELGALESEVELPDPAWRCPAPLGEIRNLSKREGVRAWAFDVSTEQWRRVGPRSRIRPGEVLLVHADDGGYDATYGFDPTSRAPVPLPDNGSPRPQVGERSDAMTDDSSNVDQPQWLSLDQHLRETADQAVAMLDALTPDLPSNLRRTVVAAALLHDVGKSHPDWQAALRRTADDTLASGDLLAKSPGRGRLALDGRHGFRHELVTALLLAEPGATDLLGYADVGHDDLPLLQYLVAAHHGKVRLQTRDAARVGGTADHLLGLRNGEQLPEATVLGVDVPGWKVSLVPFSLGGDRSWTGSALRLLQEYGPFRLAYLEALVRIADWRASSGQPVPTGGSTPTEGDQ